MTPPDDKTARLPGLWVKAPTAVIGRANLSPEARLLWLILFAHCIQQGSCSVGVKRLAAFLGRGYRQTWTLLRGLQKEGLLKIEQRPGNCHILTPIEPMQPIARVEPEPMQPIARGVCNPLHTNQIVLNQTITSPLEKAATAPKKPQKTQQPADPRVTTVLKSFCTQYEARFNVPYSVSWARDGKIVKDLLGAFDQPTIEGCITAFIRDDDPWLQNGRVSIPVFKSRINQYVQQAARQEHSPEPEQLPDLSNYAF